MDDPSSEPIFLHNNTENNPANVHWSIFDTWLGVGVFVFLVSLTLLTSTLIPSTATRVQFMVVFELLMLVPIAVVFLWRKVSWIELGFRKFEWSAIGLGCGLLVIVYVVIIIHNVILQALGVEMQADVVFGRVLQIGIPSFIFLRRYCFGAHYGRGIFSRRFLFKGFRQKYGVNIALMISSFIFALSHLQLAVLLPAFLLGCVLAYVYHRSNSLFPGMIIHFMINAWSFCALFTVYKFGGM